MSDERRKDLIDEYEEAALKLLMDEYAEADGERLMREYEEAEEKGQVDDIPEDLDKKCRHIIQESFAKHAREKKVRKSLRMLGRVAVLVLVVMGIAATTVLSVDALRVPVLNYILQHTDRYTSISINEQSNTVNDELELIKESLSYCIPEQYELVTENSNTDFLQLLYRDGEDNAISLLVSRDMGQGFVDTEEAEAENVTLNGEEAVLIHKDGLQLIWASSRNGLSYDLYADALEQEVFWEIVYALAS